MRFAPVLAVLLLSLLLSISLTEVGTLAHQQVAQGGHSIVPCDVDAYVIDQDPSGLNVRSGPAKTYAVVGNLPYKQDTGVSVHITGSSGDWVRIDSGVEEGSDEDHTFFNGEGWVYARLLGLSGIAQTKGATLLYRGTSQKSGVVQRVPGGDDVNVRGCRGKWLQVEYRKVVGWAAPNTLCSNSLTTCS